MVGVAPAEAEVVIGAVAALWLLLLVTLGGELLLGGEDEGVVDVVEFAFPFDLSPFSP